MVIESKSDEARLRRWRLVVGSGAESACDKLSGEMAEMDPALSALSDADGKNGLGRSAKRQAGSVFSVASWLWATSANTFPASSCRNWLCGLGEKHFIHTLPLMRRTFSAFTASERSDLGQRARPVQAVASAPGWDEELAALPLPLLRTISGIAA